MKGNQANLFSKCQVKILLNHDLNKASNWYNHFLENW